jgi:hypothetical protein
MADGREAFVERSPKAAEPEPPTVSRTARHIEVASRI